MEFSPFYKEGNLGSESLSNSVEINQWVSDRLGFPDSLVLRNLSAMQETRVQYLGQEDPLRKEMATHSSILAWEIPRTEEPGGQESMGSQESQTCFSD